MPSIKSYTLLLLLCFWNQFLPSSTELRFCLPQYGPQRMKDSDCPGGFVFNDPIVNPTCKYYAKTGDHNGKVLTAPTDICSENTDRVIDNEGDDLTDINSLTYFTWEDYESLNESTGSFNPANICEDECLPEWEDRNIVSDEEPIMDDFDESKVSESEKKTIKKMTTEMFLRLLLEDDDDASESSSNSQKTTTSSVTEQNKQINQTLPSNNNQSNVMLQPRANTIDASKAEVVPGHSFLTRMVHDTTQLNVIKVLSKSMRIATSACAPYLPEVFLEQVLKGMIYISRKLEHTFLDISQDLYYKIASTLDHCGLKRQQEFILNGTHCTQQSYVEGIYFTKSKEYWPHRLTGWSFRWGRWHPLLDAAWSVIDFVHSFCFESFMKNMMLLHVYVISLEGLFSNTTQQMWRLNIPMNNDKFWNNLLQTYDLNSTMRNLDACQEGARRASPFLKTIPRPFLTLQEVKKPPPPPASTSSPKGWNKTVAAYWERYDSLGGFPKISAEFGKCFDDAHLEEEEIMIESIKSQCKSGS